MDIGQTVREQPFFHGMSEPYLDFIAGCAHEVLFDANASILRENAPADYFYLLLTGNVVLTVHLPHRGAMPLETIGPGEALGWSWLAPPYRWHFDAHALEPTRAIAFDARCLRQKMTEDKELGYELMNRFVAVISQRLHAARLQVLDLYGPPGRETGA
ncbi:MAG: cyclic nucleotide-binding domain-containing protein [Ectothiorhodospiraceae bacterium]|jgi:CRP-like cAMP-binding protein